MKLLGNKLDRCPEKSSQFRTEETAEENYFNFFICLAE